jgi:hypothetical protein
MHASEVPSLWNVWWAFRSNGKFLVKFAALIVLATCLEAALAWPAMGELDLATAKADLEKLGKVFPQERTRA